MVLLFIQHKLPHPFFAGVAAVKKAKLQFIDLIHELIEDKVGLLIDSMLNERLLLVLSTKENVNLTTLGFDSDNIEKYQGLLLPIDIAGERLGTLFLYKLDAQYDIDEMCADSWKWQSKNPDGYNTPEK